MDSLAAFLVAITLLTIAPGADTILVIRNSLRSSVMDGIVTTLGICSGLFVHATVSAVGISLVILQSAWLFTGLKYLGACYLLYLGYSTLRESQSRSESIVASPDAGTFRVARSVREGLLSNVLNPKPIVFYMAFLPQFIDPEGSALGQSLQLATLHFVISVLWLSIVAITADRMRIWLRDQSIRQWIDRVLGFGLGGFGIALAFQTYRD